MLREFLETSTWSLVYDPAQQAGKKRQAKGLDKLQNEEVDTANEVDDDFKRLAWDKLKREWPAYCENSEPDDQVQAVEKLNSKFILGCVNPRLAQACVC